MSKTESRFKSKLESLKRFQHSASTSSAVEKARAFFRSLELKHLGSSGERSSSGSSFRRNPVKTSTKDTRNYVSTSVPPSRSSSKFPISSSISSSSSSSIIDDSQTTSTLDFSSNLRNSSNGIATARIIRVTNSSFTNPKDMIVHRVIDSEDEYPLRTSSYHNVQSRYSPVFTDAYIQPPRRFQNGFLNERSQSYSVSMEKHRDIAYKQDLRSLSPGTSFQQNHQFSRRPYQQLASPAVSPYRSNIRNFDTPLSTSLYNYRPISTRQMETPSLMTSSFHETSNRSDPIIRPLSSSSVSNWSQSVRRLNSEYASTVQALQRARQSLEQICPQSTTETISKYANLVARGINDLSKNTEQDLKSTLGTAFCITAVSESRPTLNTAMEMRKTSPTILNGTIPSISTSKSSLGLAAAIATTTTTTITSLSPTVTTTTTTMATMSSAIFTKPKVIRPRDLDIFGSTMSPTVPRLERAPVIKTTKENSDAVTQMIQKFNNLNSKVDDDKFSWNHDQLELFPSLQHIEKEFQENRPKSIICDVVPKEPISDNDLSNIESNEKTKSSKVNIDQSFSKTKEEEAVASSPEDSSTSTSSFSEDSTSSKISSNDEHIVIPDPSDHPIQEETTYTVETFYKPMLRNNSIISPSNDAETLVVVREETTAEQFNAVQRLNQDDPLSQRFTISQSKLPPLTTPLLTYLNMPVKQGVMKFDETKIKDNNYHSSESIVRLSSTNDQSNQDNETIDDILTINRNTCSPSLSPHCNRLNSSSPTRTVTSSTSTVIRPEHDTPLQPSRVATQSKTNLETNGDQLRVNQSSISNPLKRITIEQTETKTNTSANHSRLKPPSKIVSSLTKPKPNSSNGVKSSKTMITNNTTAMTTSMRKATGITNQSSTMTNNITNKSILQQISTSSVTTGKKVQSSNHNTMTESSSTTDSSMNIGKNRVRSMVNQLNAASRSSVTSSIPDKKITNLVNTRRTLHIDPPHNLSTSNSTIKSSVTPANRQTLQRAITINHNGPTTTSPSSISLTSTNNGPTLNSKRKPPLIRSTSNVKEGLLRWCQAQVAGYPNVSVTNLSSSWADGLAFCALTHHFFPDAFDFSSLSKNNHKENFELAFRIAEERGGVPRLLDVSDMLIMGNNPDYKCIFTYLNSFLAKVKDIHPKTDHIEQN